MYEFKMPSLGAEMEFGKIVEWKVKPGDHIKKNEILAVIDTDKAAIEVESFESGVIEKLLAQPGEKLPVGSLLALIREDNVAAPPEVLEKKQKSFEQSPMQEAIARLMTKAHQEIPHYYLSYEIEMENTLQWLAKFNNEKILTERIILPTLLIKAVALAAREHPEFNGIYQDKKYQALEQINIALVVSIQNGGLLAPVFSQADTKKISELQKTLMDLVPRARNGTLKGSEVTEASLTITNLGEYGVDAVFGVIYPPQVALIGFGNLKKQKPITMTLSGDHRVSDGIRGSRFLKTIEHFLRNPETL